MENKPKRIIILGSGGFISSYVENELNERKIDYKAIPSTLLDLTNIKSSEALSSLLLPTDTILFIAAKAPVKNERMFLINLKICKTVCEALEKVKVSHVIYISSDAVYSDIASPLNEDSDTEPNSLHGLMHLTREIMLKNIYHGPLCILRPTLIYGSKDPHNGYGPNQFIRLTKKNKEIVLFGNGEELRDHVWVKDVANIIVLTIINQTNGVLNIATGKLYSFLDIAETIIKIFKSKIKILKLTRTGPMPHNGYRAFDISNFQKIFPKFKYNNFKDVINKIGDEY
jgi:UDP-glucose 4-epimerase